MGVGEAGLDEIQDTREREGEPGREEMRDARDVDSDKGDEGKTEDEGGRTGMGDRVTSVTGSTGLEVTISQYLSWLKGDIDENIGEKTGSRVPAKRRVMYVWKPWRCRVFRVCWTRSPVMRSRA